MLLALLSTIVSTPTVKCDELVLVQTVFRHGDRAPIGRSTSRESELYYFRGKEHLTNKGLEQARELGSSLKHRYVETGFIDSRYLPSEVVFRSSPSERCLMTASAAATAMFNATEYNQSLSVPIFTVPKAEDYLLVPRLRCPFVLKEMREVLGISRTSLTLDQILDELFAQEAKRLNYTHVVGKRLGTFEQVYLEQESGLTPPQWFNEEAKKEADHLLDLTIEFMSGTGTFHNEKWILTRSGKLLFTILKNHADAAHESYNGTKFFAFATHDVVISALLDSMGVLKEALSPQGRPGFTAAIVFEFWKQGNEHYMKVLYRKGPESSDFTDITAKIKKCEDRCSPLAFADSVKSYQTDSPESLCENEGLKIVSQPANGIQPATIFFMSTTALFVVLFLAELVLLVRQWRSTRSKTGDL